MSHQCRVFTLSLFTNNNRIDSLMARLHARKAGNVDNIRVEIELIAELHVERLQLASTRKVRRREDSLEANLILADRGDDIFEWRAHRWIHLGEEERLKVDRHTDCLEHLLHRIDELGTDTIAGNQRACRPSLRLRVIQSRCRVDASR